MSDHVEGLESVRAGTVVVCGGRTLRLLATVIVEPVSDALTPLASETGQGRDRDEEIDANSFGAKRSVFRARATLEQIYVLLTGAQVREGKRERARDLAEARSVCEQSFRLAAEADAVISAPLASSSAPQGEQKDDPALDTARQLVEDVCECGDTDGEHSGRRETIYAPPDGPCAVDGCSCQRFTSAKLIVSRQSSASEIRCRLCGEDIRLMDGEWRDRKTHRACKILDAEGLPREDAPRHEPQGEPEAERNYLWILKNQILPNQYALKRVALLKAIEVLEALPSASSVPVRASGEPQKLAEMIIRMRAVIEAVRAVGKQGHWDAPHWTLRVPAREANALFDLAYELDPALASASPSDDGAVEPPIAGPPINALCSRCSCIVGHNALVHDVTIADGRVRILRCNNRRTDAPTHAAQEPKADHEEVIAAMLAACEVTIQRRTDEERRRWYAAFEWVGIDLEGLAPEVVAENIRQALGVK